MEKDIAAHTLTTLIQDLQAALQKATAIHSRNSIADTHLYKLRQDSATGVIKRIRDRPLQHLIVYTPTRKLVSLCMILITIIHILFTYYSPSIWTYWGVLVLADGLITIWFK